MPSTVSTVSIRPDEIDWDPDGEPVPLALVRAEQPPIDLEEVDWDIPVPLPSPPPPLRIVQSVDFSALVTACVPETPSVQGPVVDFSGSASIPEGSCDVIASGEDWDWRALRDYVVRRSTEIHGPAPSNPAKEAAIIKAFISRWGPQRSGAIARCAFEVYGGFWRGAPIRVERFSKGSDPFFAEVLAAET